MMKYILHTVGSAIELIYCWLMFSAFLQPRRQKEENRWFLAILWLLTSCYSILAADSVSPMLIRMLAMVLILIYIFDETGQKGLRILLITYVIPVVGEVSVRYLVKPAQGLFLWAMTASRLLCVFCAWFIRRYLADRLKRQAVQELEMRLQRQHMEMQTESINALEQNYRQQRKVTHEFERHIQVLDDLLDAGAVEEAKEYIHRLRGSRSYRVISVNSRHTVMDVILNQKYQIAQENGIKVQIRVNDLSAVTLATDSLVVILSNLLDNAIEACRAVDGYKELDCSVLCDEGLYISVQNTSRPVTITDGKIETSKSDKLEHGYGMHNVCLLLDKLDAEYTFDYSDGWFRFAAEIPN